jgi:sulfate transport system ATP-binding protein
VAVDDVSLTVPTGELVALLGPSGSGKTSLLRIIAGLERADRGQVLFEGEDATARDVRRRGVGFVFQHYALFPAHDGLRERGLRLAGARWWS